MDLPDEAREIPAMGRKTRSYHPGMVFHLVSRTHRREPWFTPKLRSALVELIQGMIARTDAKLLAYAVMPNHLHIIVRQGRMQLGTVMQPLLRRVALRVQRLHGFEGSVVERRFRDRPCATPDHTRMAIVYTHLNPWRAGLCDTDHSYPWTSHAAYLPGSDPTIHGIEPEAQQRILELFADHDGLTRDGLAVKYLEFVEWRMAADKLQAESENGVVDEVQITPPSTVAGDRAWQAHFQNLAPKFVEPLLPLPDLRDFIRALTSVHHPAINIEMLRGSYRPHQISRLRARLIRAAADRGFRTGEIARFFAISPQSVSRLKYESDAESAGH